MRILDIGESLLTVEQMAKALCISRSLAYRLVQKGDIPSVHINTAVRIHPTDLDRFIHHNRVNPSEFDSEY